MRSPNVKKPNIDSPKNTCETKPLFFASGKHMFPTCIFIEPLDEMTQARFVNGLTNQCIVNLLGGQRVSDGAAQGPQRDVGLLRQ
jgi:hypothetical protein